MPSDIRSTARSPDSASPPADRRPEAWEHALERLAALVDGRSVVVLTGAGCSTESGIPDYRGPEGTLRKRAPIQYGEFVRQREARVRYWARSAVGWPRLSTCRPNEGHRALARLEAGGVVAGVITQNVDGLHQAAGSRRVVELHGALAGVRCLACRRTTSRADFQHRLLASNQEWAERLRLQLASGAIEVAPDGDAELPARAVETFRVPACPACHGVLKPDVVFFGESVPRERVEAAWRLFDDADVLLVAGSSLAVYSGRRFIYRAREEAKPVAVVNLGPTRADDMATVRVEAPLGRALPRLAARVLDAA